MHIHPQLSLLATTAGLATGWVDAFGKAQLVGEDTLRNVLEALGLPCQSPQQCADSQRRLEDEQQQRVLPPLLTGSVGSSLSLSPALRLHGMRYEIALEHGGSISGMFEQDTSQPLLTPIISQSGYHQLRVGKHQVTLAIAPALCFGIRDLDIAPERKVWGPSVQLYALRDGDDGGLGTYSALAKLARQTGLQGASALAISPVHAMFSADAGRYSPYGPSSRMHFNAMHVDPRTISGQQAYATALQEDAQAALAYAQLNQQALIDWPASSGQRLALLRSLFQRFQQESGDRQQAFADYRREGGDALQDHAIYEALHAYLRQESGSDDWRLWPQGYRHPANREVQDFVAQHAHEVSFHAFLQWQSALGLQAAQHAALDGGMAIGLISDLAVGADPKGSQAWMRREQFLQGLSVGAPPDLFFSAGQAWGINALSTQGLRQHGFQAYIEMLRSAFRHAGGVRIDHVLGLIRLWLVPEGGSAGDGVYLHYPTDDLMRLISLESHRHRAIVIGEDLGTLPEGCRNQFSQAGILGMNVLWFEREGAVFTPPPAWSRTSIATTGTHDLATVAGWWLGSDIELQALPPDALQLAQLQRADDRQALLNALKSTAGSAAVAQLQALAGDLRAPQPASVQPVVDAVLQLVASSHAPLTIIPMEDLLGLQDQPNLPGTIDSHPNWRRRLPDVVEALMENPDLQRRFAILNGGHATH